MNAILETSAAMSAVIAVMLAVTPLLRKKYNSRLQYTIWLIIALRLCIPINITLPRTLITITPNHNITIPEIQNNAGTEKILNTEQNISQQIQTEKTYEKPDVSNELTKAVIMLIITKSIPFVWITGSLIFFLYHIISYLNFRRKIKHHIKESNIECKLKVYICEKIAGPMMIGFFRPIILLPDIEYTDEEIECIIAHELTHYHRRDIWYKLLLVTANAVHFFNPLVYIMRINADRNIEYVCDEEVCKDKDINFKKIYSMTILKSMKNKNHTVFSDSLSAEGRKVHKRLKNIFFHKRKKGSLMIIPIFIVSLTVCAFVSINREYSLTSISPDDVGTITVFDGNTGRQIDITDEEQTEHIINNFNNTKMYKSGISIFNMGYSMRVTIYKKDMKKYKEFIINSPSLIRDDPFFYTAPYTVDYYYIENLFTPVPAETAIRIDELINVIASSPAFSSNPNDYISAHKEEYDEIAGMGRDALVYLFSLFEKGGNTGLEGHIMQRICADLTEDEGIVFASAEGQEWYDKFREYMITEYNKLGYENVCELYPLSSAVLEYIIN